MYVPPGIAVNQTYGECEIPDGWVSVQRDDDDQRYTSDEAAARHLALVWRTETRYSPSDDVVHGDWIVRRPDERRF